MVPVKEELVKEVVFKTSRSGGKGGQNVNKVSSKVELIFNIDDSSFFSQEEKQRLLETLATKLDSQSLLHVVSQVDRSQLANKETALNKLSKILEKALEVKKKRKPTKIPRAVKEKRLTNKLAITAKKEARKKPLL